MIETTNTLMDHPAFKLNLINDVFVNVHHKRGVMSLEDFNCMSNEVEQWSKQYGKIFVVNTQDLQFKFANETWRFIQSVDFDPSDFVVVQALVAQELHFRVLAKLHLKIKPSKIETKIVSSLKLGVEWLELKRQKLIY